MDIEEMRMPCCAN